MQSDLHLHGLLIEFSLDYGEDPYLAVDLSESTPGYAPSVEILEVDVLDARTFIEQVRRQRNQPRISAWAWVEGPGLAEVTEAIYDQEQVR